MSAAASYIQRPQRWDEPFAADMSEELAARVLTRTPFSGLDPARFPRTMPLTEILRNDARIERYAPGDIVVRQGDYGNSAFFILEGAARVSVSSGDWGLSQALLGRQPARRRRGWFASVAQLLRRSSIPEARDFRPPMGPMKSKGPGRTLVDGLGTRYVGADRIRVFLHDVPAVVARYDTVRLGPGEAFGEIAALSRTPRTATVFAESELEVVEIRWQGLRDIRNRCPEVKEHLDRRYRERSLLAQLRETPILAHLSDRELQQIANLTEFETYGSFNWSSSYKTLTKQSSAARLGNEPLIVEEGDYPNGLLLVRSGFARVSERYGKSHRTVRYLSRGQMFGLEELFHNWRHGDQQALRWSLRALGYADLLLIPTSTLERYVFPSLAPEMRPRALEPSPSAEPAEPRPAQSLLSLVNLVERHSQPRPRVPVGDDFLEQLVEERFINGTATMMIDLDRCTRCDECVRACANAHEGNPRFIRHGREVGRFMIANACMHCADPVCMIGCPTGAIQREPDGGQVVINEAHCIGCATCADSCPYDNIRMVEIRDQRGAFVIDQFTGRPLLKATKCDLCVGQLVAPACEQACPHAALHRVNMSDLDAVRSWEKR